MPCILAIDPGRSKCGVAVVAASGEVLHRGIVAAEALAEEASRLFEAFAPRAVVMGDGTGSAAAAERLTAVVGVPVERVDERHTSEAARARWLADHPARGLRRLLPAGLRTPDTPYDDYVAVILAERWWQSERDRQV
jgi:RNase H-fold protein (predicted Holliday junction resolvase)